MPASISLLDARAYYSYYSYYSHAYYFHAYYFHAYYSHAYYFYGYYTPLILITRGSKLAQSANLLLNSLLYYANAYYSS
jgi:hypothetical protein